MRLRSVVTASAGFREGAVWARYGSRRVAERRRRKRASLVTFLQVSGWFPLTNAVVGKGSRSRSKPSASFR